MSDIRVAWGTATGPTELSSYDRALAGANVHNYNLVTVSSMIPADAPLEVVETAPDLGPVGNKLTVVQSRATVEGPEETAAAGIGWARTADGPGIFYEAAGSDPQSVRYEISDGLDAGLELRDWDATERETIVKSIDGVADGSATAVVIAAYGESESIV
jgi:arginine decarboxylase